VKPLSEMTRLELAAHIGAEFKRRNIIMTPRRVSVS
jgi:hypothetical protein